ncbi:MAG: diacylglycerol kinase family lipid kinase [Chloroflexota bacterium]|nr:diacylglycerol kinase family lipid kinase [Chloroflexota bacterium]
MAIVNPASGVNRSALDSIQAFFAAHRDTLESIIHLTQASGDAKRFAEQAVADNVDIVAAYGGDGTMMETATGLMGSTVPMLMLPGGTANVMSIDLGIPTELEDALDLILNPDAQVRAVDMGSIDNEYFLLRAGIGYEAEMSASAARGDKSKRGRWAYVQNAFRKLRNLRPVQYVLTVDGETYVRKGVTCMICNSSSIGIPNLRFVYNGDVSDGLLDVIVIPNMQLGTLLKTLFHIFRSVVTDPTVQGGTHIDHWQGKEVTVQMRERQFVARDGEPFKRTKRVSAHIIPQAVYIVVPPTAATVAVPTVPLEDIDGSLDRNPATT